ncbi:MAG: hypothetical protein HKN45_10340 [Flavobacteriales bacterium]|nr:hypothetical protein [Flavobacteriales bacterium]NNK80454.1 hypothetical protein [Flavobacteriales bacterium]
MNREQGYKGTDSTGFSRDADVHAQSYINKDGSFNVYKKGQVKLLKDLYQYMLMVGPMRFLGIILIYFLCVNFMYGTAYYMMGMDNFTIPSTGEEMSDFFNCVFFSFQTFSTLGYGHISPITMIANVVSVFEMFTGMVSLALLAGLVYARFSRPNTRLLFSNNFLVTPHRGKDSLQFRFVNKRKTVLNDVHVRVMVAFTESKDGKLFREFHRLQLQMDNIMFFPLTWTTVHLIDEKSIFYGMTPEEIEAKSPEILIRVRAFSEQFNQHIHANFSYSYDEWIWNAKFEKAFELLPEGKFFIDIHDVHNYVTLPKFDYSEGLSRRARS